MRLNADRLPNHFFTGVQMQISKTNGETKPGQKKNFQAASRPPFRESATFSGGSEIVLDVMIANGGGGAIGALNKGVTLIQNGTTRRGVSQPNAGKLHSRIQMSRAEYQELAQKQGGFFGKRLLSFGGTNGLVPLATRSHD